MNLVKFNFNNKLLCIAIINTVFTASVFAADVFVATTGVDNLTSNDGSISQPWASLDFALEQVVAGDTINIRAGSYHENITQGSVSGTASQPITIQSYNGEQVTFDGTIPLTGSWAKHSASIYKLQLTEPVWQLFVDDEMMMNARWPNARFDDGSVYTRESWAKGLDGTTTNGHFDTDPAVHDLAATSIDATGAVVIANVRNFNSYTRSVSSHTAGSNTFEYGTVPHFGSSKNYYYLQGALSLLDQNKEWHIDAGTNMAYLWAPNSSVPTGNIRGRNQQYVIDADNWQYVTFKGLDFFATTLELKGAESITIEDCHFNYSGGAKRALGETDTRPALLTLFNGKSTTGNFVLRNVSITNSDSQAFYIKGENTIVENSLFENFDWAATETYLTSSALVFSGANALLTGNTIRNAGTSETVASNGTIEAAYNDIYNTGYAQSDGAIIQIGVKNQNGSVVHHNWLHDTPKYGFRFDAPIPPPAWGEYGFSHHNVVWNSSGANPKGDHIRNYNNLLFNNSDVDLIILSEKTAAGDWSNEFTTTTNNAADSISSARKSQTTIPGVVGSNFNGYNEAELLKTLLRDPANHDFRPVAGSSLVDAGDTIYDVDFSHPTQGSAPDLGAYEDGESNYWIPGRKLAAASYPIPFDAGSTAKTDADLMWREAYTATSYDVYFGMTSGSLTAKGNQTNNIFNPGALVVGQTYYWRIDAVTPAGTMTGDEWRFSIDAAPVTINLIPVADAYVDDSSPDANKGSDTAIELKTPTAPGGSDEQRYGFLKFNVDVPGTIISATLKLYNEGGNTTKEVNVHTLADTSWEESLITWNNQPVMGVSMQQSDIASTSWQAFDVTTAVSGNGLLSLGLKRAASNSRRSVAARESAFAPELIIEYIPAAGSNNAPVFTADPFSKTNATEAVAYSASIASDATDVDGDSLSFEKVSGADWLQVAANGDLSGTPVLADVGENSFDIKVTDSAGDFANATLTITITAKGTDSGTGTDDSGTGTDDSGTGTDDSGTGTDDSGTGTDDSGTGTDDSGTGTDDSGTEDSEKSSSGGSVYYLGLLLLAICLYRRRSYLFA